MSARNTAGPLIVLSVAFAAGLASCASSDRTSPSGVETTSSSAEFRVEVNTTSTAATTTDAPARSSTSTTSSTTSTSATAASTTTSAPQLTDPQLLAGGRVLCAYVGQDVPESVLDRLRQGLAAGVLMFGYNVEDQRATLTATAAIQEASTASPAAAPALITIDQEGGTVARLPGPPSAGASQLGTLDATAIRDEGRATGANLRTWGINVDLAPVADVERGGGFIERQARSFGRDPTTVGASVAAFVEGLGAAGVGSALKHFPGLGAATESTDEEVTVVDLSADELRSLDLPPFSAGIDAGADMVMMSSAIYPAIDDQPALFSSIWIEDVLRGELGFDGVVVSDALDTPALEPAGTIGERAVRAAAAGTDLLIGSSPQTCVDAQVALADAIATGELPLEQAQLAYRRVHELRVDLAAASQTPQPSAATTPTTPELRAGATPYVVPSPDPGASWSETHAGYTATDIFVPSGCGGDVVSPVDGVLLEVRRVDGWDSAVDNPATRGGRSIAILGDDGVRYYLAHFADIEAPLAPGVRVTAGDRLGSVGTTGRSSACHIHFGISPPCPDTEWSVRRGAIWPYPYLDAWRRGEQLSPADEISSWIADHPDACALAALDPHAGDA